MQGGVGPTTPNHPPAPQQFFMPKHRGPEWDYVTVAEPDGTDEENVEG